MKNGLLVKVLLAIALAVTAGLITGVEKTFFGIPFFQIYNLIGQLFLNALSLVVVPLVASSIIIGMARMGTDQAFGSLGLKTFGYFILTSFCAILIGVAVALIFSPGSASDLSSTLASKINLDQLAEIQKQTQISGFQSVEQILLKVVPANIIFAASQGQMLGIIVFCMLFGYFISKTESHAASILLGFWKGVFQIMMQITQLVIKALPLGVFGLVAKAIAMTGLEAIVSMAYFFCTVIIGLGVYGFVFLPLLLKSVAKLNPLEYIRALFPALITAFSTTSSAATLPVTIDCVEKRAGISNRISSFILPLGTSVNLSGSALYTCVSVLFIAQSYGVHLTIPSLCVVVLMTLLSSLGTAGIPSASMFSVIVILNTLGLPADGIALIMAVERILDMFRTPVNVFGTACCAALVAKSEGEKNILAVSNENPSVEPS